VLFRSGKYFRATDNTKLRSIYQEIDKMEKTKINISEYSKKNEMYPYFVMIAFILLSLEIVLRNTILNKLP
jgi:Ca-activated chloride channel family protein